MNNTPIYRYTSHRNRLSIQVRRLFMFLTGDRLVRITSLPALRMFEAVWASKRSA